MINLNNSTKRNFIKFAQFLTRGSFCTSRKKYFDPFDFEQINLVNPAGKIPSHIKRPNYVLNPKYEPKYKEASIINNPEDLKKFRRACQIAAGAVERAIKIVEEGITTDDIDKVVHSYIVSQDAYPSGVGYMGFPKSVCTSVNEIVCHGIPNRRKLQKGDFLNIDVTAYFDGFHGDTSGMACVGTPDPDIARLIDTTRESMFKAISICRPGEKISRIGEVIEGYTVCKEFCGHGVGKELHMTPLVRHYKDSDISNDFVMVPGLAITIEPIILMYPYDDIYMLDDNWTIYTPNNPSAQWEHSILITDNGFEVLTKRDDEKLLLNIL